MPIINLLRPDQDEALRSIEPALAAMPDFESSCRFLTAAVRAVLSAPAVVLEQAKADQWRLVAVAGTVPPAEAMIQSGRRALATLSDSTHRVSDVALEDGWWTCLLLRRTRERVLLLMVAGDWTLSRVLLQQLTARLGDALEQVPPPRRSHEGRQQVAVASLPQRLARAVDVADSLQIVLEACAAGVGAQKASIAMYDREQESLSVVATFGYPVVLVKHVRIRPGEAVIGRVFQTGRPLRVGDIQTLPGAPEARLRYRTRSFIAVPLVIRSDVVGVISVTDAEEGQFSRHALRSLRAIAGVASLALDRSNALKEAAAHARLAAIDPLTGLFNRRYFISRLHEEVERARRQASDLSVLILDVDNFKALNDRFGHSVGDAELRIAGDVLRRSVRSFDVCARWGGDEFAILMPGSVPESARQIAERIRSGVEAAQPTARWVDDLKVTVSVGLATHSGGTAEDLIERADQALYSAKRAGKNRVHSSENPADRTAS